MTLTNRRAFLAGSAAGILQLGAARTGQTHEKGGKRPIKIGQIGVGHAHAGKLAAFRASADYEVVGIVEPKASLREQAQSQAAFRDLPWMTREQLLNVPGLEAVLIETQVRDLLANAEAAVSAGKHIHLDKPAGASLEHFRKILEDAQRQKLLLQMGYMYRYNPAVVLLHELLERGWLGEIFEVHAVMSKVVAAADRQRLAEFAGGIMFELGCHMIDLVVGMLGKPDRVRGYARHSAVPADALADNMLAVFEYSRALATVKSSALEVEGFARRHLAVCGTKGTYHIQPLDNPQARLALDEPRARYKAGYQTIEFPAYTRYVDDAADMAAIIRGERPPRYSYAHDLAVQESLLQACAPQA
jgi:predicted dehydrogenase